MKNLPRMDMNTISVPKTTSMEMNKTSKPKNLDRKEKEQSFNTRNILEGNSFNFNTKRSRKEKEQIKDSCIITFQHFKYNLHISFKTFKNLNKI